MTATDRHHRLRNRAGERTDPHEGHRPGGIGGKNAVLAQGALGDIPLKGQIGISCENLHGRGRGDFRPL
jgi:hypothetical protein